LVYCTYISKILSLTDLFTVYVIVLGRGINQIWERLNIIRRFEGGGCSNCQSAVIWERGLAKSLYNFLSG